MRECVIHGDLISGWDPLYDQLSRNLNLPEWFGRNLDALFDCLTDLEDAQITIYHWGRLSDCLGTKANALRQESSVPSSCNRNRGLRPCWGQTR